MANSNKGKNLLTKIKVNGVWLSKEDEVKQGVSRAFQKLLSALKVWRPPFPSLAFNRLSKTEVASLEVPFTKEEIFDALFDLNGDKASRPYGFTFVFW